MNRSERRAAERKAKKIEIKALKAIARGQTINTPPALPVPMHHPITIPSPGPLTPEGRAKSAQNSRKHGCCSRTIQLTNDESTADYQALENCWFAGYNTDPSNPETYLESELIRACINADWLARRAELKYSDLEADLLDATPKLNDWTNEHYKKLNLANRYRVANRNTLIKARKALEDHRKARSAEKLLEQKLRQIEEKLTINKETPASAGCDFPRIRTWEECLAQATADPIRDGYINPDRTLTGKPFPNQS